MEFGDRGGSNSVSVTVSFSRCGQGLSAGAHEFVFCSEAVIERSEIDWDRLWKIEKLWEGFNHVTVLFFNLLSPFSQSSYELGQPKPLHSSDSPLSMWQGPRRKEEVGDVGKETEATGTFPTEEKATSANDRNLARFEKDWQRFDTTNII